MGQVTQKACSLLLHVHHCPCLHRIAAVMVPRPLSGNNLTDKLLRLSLKKKKTNLCCARAPGRIAVLLALSCRVLWLLRFPWLKTSLENLSRCLGSVLLSKVSVLHLSNPADGAISTGWYFLNIQQKWVAKRYYLCGCCSSLSQEGLC